MSAFFAGVGVGFLTACAIIAGFIAIALRRFLPHDIEELAGDPVIPPAPEDEAQMKRLRALGLDYRAVRL